MKKNKILMILLCLLIALPFYVSAWTWEGVGIGQRWLYSGFVTLVAGFVIAFWYL